MTNPFKVSFSVVDASTHTVSLVTMNHLSPIVSPNQDLKPLQRRNPMSLSFINNSDDECEQNELNQQEVITYSHVAYDDMPSFITESPLCSKRNCFRSAHTIYRGFGGFCKSHKPSRLCKVDQCDKCAKTGGYCIAHGGGRRCRAEGCVKSAKERGFCIAHGGGKRCLLENCCKSALAGGLCSAHGGGKRCSNDGCSKTALKGGRCIAHGGGRRCQVVGCAKSAVGGHLCVSHGGGRRCGELGCDKGAVRNGLCIRHGARR